MHHTGVVFQTRILRACISPVAMYGCEAMTFKKAVEKDTEVLQKSPPYILDREENKYIYPERTQNQRKH